MGGTVLVVSQQQVRCWFCLMITLLLTQISCVPKMKKFAANDATLVPEVSGTDPYFSDQWYLQESSSSQAGIKAASVWRQGNRGDGIKIAVVDPSSIYLGHPDLTWNKDLARSFNYLYPLRGANTLSPEEFAHGTCVAGIIAARDENSIGIRGIASRASLSARSTSGRNSDLLDALIYKINDVAVSSNSYGPPDDSSALNQWFDNPYLGAGIENGLVNGRNGLGTIFVWAAGNGRFESDDRSNYDGFASHFGVMSICSVGKTGQVSMFSEPGSNLWVCAPGEKIPVTDELNKNCASNEDNQTELDGDYESPDYNKFFQGTSASAPVVSGVVGLILREAQLRGKSLGWRDVKMIIAESAYQPAWVEWQPSTIRFNDDYGFGIVDAEAAVAMVKNWLPVGNSVEWSSKGIPATGFLPAPSPSAIPTATPMTSKITIKKSSRGATENSPTLFVYDIDYIEHIDLEVKLTHPEVGELEIDLIKTKFDPITGLPTVTTMTSTISTSNNNGANGTSSNKTFKFGVSNFLGEPAEGEWTLSIRDAADGNSGTLGGWRMTIYGH